MVLIVEDNDSLLIPMLYALVSGLVALLLLLMFTTPDKPPKWHKALCAVGFVVAIGWISTIADEVVGILRAFGAIVNVSEAILGVTVFAMVILSVIFLTTQGNSLSDFVADVTVAKMGYPMMAMSACFGGPMLSIFSF
jgi:solute carrier family 24 (sodium/potassium/calcium exchanger), member 6